MKSIGKLVGSLIKLIVTLSFLAVLGVGFMYATTGSVNIKDFFSEFQSDYRDLDLKRPPKETEFTRMMDTSKRLGAKKDITGSNGVMTDSQYNAILTKYASNLNKSLINLPKGQKENKKLFMLNFSDKDKIKAHKEVVNKSRNDVKKVTAEYENQVKGKKVPKKYEGINELILDANKDFNEGLNQFSAGIETKNNVLVYKAVKIVYEGKDKMDEVNKELEGVK